MHIYHQKAIQLKYHGYTCSEISKAMDGKISPDVLYKLFATDGTLYIPYLEYEANMNSWAEEESRKEYKRMTGWTAKVQQQLLKSAMKDKDYRLAWEIIKDINDRAGLVVVKKSQVNVTDDQAKELTDEQYHEELTRLRLNRQPVVRVESVTPGTN